MTHEEIEELLGVYALDAIEPAERLEIEAHLSGCPRCRAEVAAHQEMAALLGSAGTEAPAGLWEKIATVIAEADQGPANEPPTLLVPLRGGPERRRAADKRQKGLVWGAIAAAAAAVVAVLGVEVAQLHGQVETLHKEMLAAGLKNAALEVDAGPHQTISLALADHKAAATVIVASSGQAYWLGSSLNNLPTSQTYQLWGLSRGKPVSLALVGAHPDTTDFFTLQPGITELMVTAEPEGGTPGPTTAVLAQGAVPPSAVS